MAKVKKLGSYGEYVNGSGMDDQGLCGVLDAALKAAKSKSWIERNKGPIDRISIVIESETKTRSGQAFSREVSTAHKPEQVAAAILAGLKNDPGPSFEGRLRAYVSVAGNTSLRFGTYQRQIATGFVSADSIDEEWGKEAVSVAVLERIVIPLLNSQVAMATECARTTHEAAEVVAAAGSAQRATGEGIGAIVGMVRKETDGGMLDLVGKVLGGAATGGVPGAAAAAGVVEAVSEVTASTPALADRPLLMGAGGAEKVETPPAPFGLSGSRVGVGSSGASVHDPTVDRGGAVDPSQLTRAQVEAWAEAHPADAERMVREALRAKGVSPALLGLA